MKIYYKISLLLFLMMYLSLRVAAIFIDGKTEPPLFWQFFLISIILNTIITLIIFIYKHIICKQKL